MSNGSKISPKHSHQYEIADRDAVQALLKKLNGPGGCAGINEHKICQAIDTAAQQYQNSAEEVRQAFFHGLLTGYSVLLQTEKATGASGPAPETNMEKTTSAGEMNQSRSKTAGR